jgi:hypothetical protein
MAVFCSFVILFSLDHQVNANRVPDGKYCVVHTGRKGNDILYTFGWKSCGKNRSGNGVVLKPTAVKKTVTMWTRLNGSSRFL